VVISDIFVSIVFESIKQTERNKMQGLSRSTALEIFTNHEDLCISIGRENEGEKLFQKHQRYIHVTGVLLIF
jgi:predicted transcriptional regulator